MLQDFHRRTTPDTGAPRLATLRAAMAAAGVDAFLVPRADAHQGENVAAPRRAAGLAHRLHRLGGNRGRHRATALRSSSTAATGSRSGARWTLRLRDPPHPRGQVSRSGSPKRCRAEAGSASTPGSIPPARSRNSPRRSVRARSASCVSRTSSMRSGRTSRRRRRGDGRRTRRISPAAAPPTSAAKSRAGSSPATSQRWSSPFPTPSPGC